MQKGTVLLLFFFTSSTAQACITCNKQIQQAIWNSTFVPNLVSLLSAFIVLGIIVAILTVIAAKKHQAKFTNQSGTIASPLPLTTASIILGIGLGGFIDGIVLHQILQWHEMLSNQLPPVNYVAKSVNMFWDGIFHLFCLLVVMTGMVLLWKLLQRKDVDKSGNLFSGGLVAGWGIFNIVEGLIDHQLLKLHNVREVTANIPAWNYGFLFVSVLMILIGWGLIKRRRHNENQVTA